MTNIDSSEVRARLEYIERSLFGAPLTVERVEPPVREPKSHQCIPAIVEPTEDDTIAALDALNALVESEEENFRALQRAEAALLALRTEGRTPFVVAELRAAFERLDTRYSDVDGGATVTSDEFTALANEARDMVGRVTGNRIALADGAEDAFPDLGFTQRWHLRGETEDEFLDRNTCAACRPNLEEMIRRDRAAGIWPHKEAQA